MESNSFVLFNPQLGGLPIQSTRNMFGRQVNSFEAPVHVCNPALRGSSSEPDAVAVDSCHGVFIRAPGINKLLSPDVEVLGTLADKEKTIVAVRHRNLIGTCFHPELTKDLRWHRYFVDSVLELKCESPQKDTSKR